MNPPIRWGILGTGKIAHAFALALHSLADAKLVAVASRSSDSATQFGQKFDVERCHASYQALAEDDAVDVIYIATPHALHAENALLCLHAGKHVLCEKSFTINLREAQEVVAVARQKNLFLMEAMWTRFLPAVLEAKRIIASGEIGQPQQMQSDFGFVGQFGPEHRLNNRQLGGGVLLDIGVYMLSMAGFFLGPVAADMAQSVQACAEIGASGVDVHTSFWLRHQSGAMSSCVCSSRARTPVELTISGPLGHLRLHTRFYQATSLTVTLADGSTRTIDCPLLGNGYAHEAIEVMRCLRAGLIESPLMSHQETLAQMATLDAIRAQIGLTYDADVIK